MDLEDIRVQIDKIDDEILKLFCKRMNLVEGVARYKLENGMQVLRPEREQVILDRVTAESEPKYKEYTEDIFVQLMRISREMQQKMIDEAK